MTQGNAYRYELGVHDMAELPRKPVEANIEVLVMDVGTGSKASIYSDASLATAKTNPITTTVFAADKGIKFWCDAGSVDLVLISAGYGSGIFYDVTSNIGPQVWCRRHPRRTHLSGRQARSHDRGGPAESDVYRVTRLTTGTGRGSSRSR